MYRDCPLCKNPKENSIPLKGTTICCKKCSLVYNCKLPDLTVDKYWENFNFDEGIQEYDIKRENYFNYFWHYICQTTKKKEGNFLDVGCGAGLLLKIAKLHNWKAEGLELSLPLCQFAQKNSGCRVLEGAIEQIVLPDQTYDLILFSDVFRCLVDPLLALKKCYKSLKNNGIVVIRELNIDHSSSKKRALENISYDLQFLSPKTANLFLKNSGFSKVEFYPSPVSLLTVSFLKNQDIKIINFLMQAFNKFIHLSYQLSFKNWLTIVPEMLIIGRKIK